MAYTDTVRTAQQVLEGNSDHVSENKLRAQRIAEAEAAGVTRTEYIDYAEAMTNYESRDDVEPLAERRARDNGLYADQDFRREGTGSVGVITSPGDGNVGGLKDIEGNDLDTPGA